MPKVLDLSKNTELDTVLAKSFKTRIVGQEQAVACLEDMVGMFQAGFSDPSRPAGNALFLGPTGSGKTRVVESLAEGLFGDPRACMKVDCAEFQHSHEIAKLIGSPPGYLGHRETHPMFTQEALNQWHTTQIKLSIVLFDEIEKASDSLWQLLLGVLDKATLTLGDNRRVNFSSTIIVMTSNLGAQQMSTLVDGGLGFLLPDNATEPVLDQKMDDIAIQAAKKKFTPEFWNRLNKVVVFKTLTHEQIEKIMQIELGRLQTQLLANEKIPTFVFFPSKRVREVLLEEGFSKKYGARHLKRAIERRITLPMSRLVRTKQITPGSIVLIDEVGEEHFRFTLSDDRIPLMAKDVVSPTSK